MVDISVHILIMPDTEIVVSPTRIQELQMARKAVIEAEKKARHAARSAERDAKRSIRRAEKVAMKSIHTKDTASAHTNAKDDRTILSLPLPLPLPLRLPRFCLGRKIKIR